MSQMFSFGLRGWLRREFDELFREGVEVMRLTGEHIASADPEVAEEVEGEEETLEQRQSTGLVILSTALLTWLFAMRAVKEVAMSEQEFEAWHSTVRIARFGPIGPDAVSQLPDPLPAVAIRLNALLAKVQKADELYFGEGDAILEKQA
jgi:hypothetical protein